MAHVGALRQAVRTSNISLVKRLVKGGVNVDERLWYGRTLLHECVTISDVQMVKSLIQYGEADVNAQNDDGKTALHMASRAGSFDIVSLLLDAGAQTDIQCLDGTTSLHLATWKDRSQVVKKLLKSGANPNLQDQDNWTPLHWAVQNRNLELVKMLVEHGAQIDVVNKSLLTSFTLSLEIACYDISKYLLVMGAGVRTINDTKKKPKSVISLLLSPQIVTSNQIHVLKFVNVLVENGYNLWHEHQLLSAETMADMECEKIRQQLLLKISEPPDLLTLCRHRVWDLLCHIRVREKFLVAVRSLQIPVHLESFLLIKAEHQQEVNQSCRERKKPEGESQKTGLIQLKKTDVSPKKLLPTRIVFNDVSQSVRKNSPNGKQDKAVRKRIIFNSSSQPAENSSCSVPRVTSLKKTIPTKIVFNDLLQTAESTSVTKRHTIALKKVMPKRIVFNDLHQNTESNSSKKRILTKITISNTLPTTESNMNETYSTLNVPSRIVFTPPQPIEGSSLNTSQGTSHSATKGTTLTKDQSTSLKNVIPTRIVFDSTPSTTLDALGSQGTSSIKMVPSRNVFNSYPTPTESTSKSQCTSQENMTSARTVVDSCSSTSKGTSESQDTSLKKIVPTKIILNSSPSSNEGTSENQSNSRTNMLPSRTIINSCSNVRESTPENEGASAEKMVPSNIVFNSCSNAKQGISENSGTSPKKIVPTRIVFNSSPNVTESTSESQGTSAKKMVPLRIVFNSSPTSKEDSFESQDTSPPKIPKRVVFNEQAPTGFQIEQTGKNRVISLQTIPSESLNATISPTKDVTVLSGVKAKKPETFRVISSLESSSSSSVRNDNKAICSTDKVRKLCRLSFAEMTQESSNCSSSSAVERHSRKRRAWKPEASLG